MNRLITEMSTDEFDTVIDAYIERETRDTGDLPAPLFYQTLRDIFGKVAELPGEETSIQSRFTIALERVAAGSRLILSSLPEASLPADLREIEVDLPGIRVLVGLKPLAA